MKIIRLICRVIAGSVFIFSGIVKAIDPLGSAYKFHDYFQAFNLDFLQPVSLFLSILLCTAEFITGFCVLSGIRMREGIAGISLLILFFTPLTFVLALTNPVSDCGCFGDAVKLTNWETFGKNIVLFIAILILFLQRKNFQPYLKPAAEWMITLSAVVLFTGFAFYNLRYLPVIDFLPYSAGTNIQDKMKMPEGAEPDRYETTFIYEKDGVKKEFTLSDYPANDTSWKFVSQKSVLVARGYVPPIHDFSISTTENVNITDSVLNNDGYTLLMISSRLEDAGTDKLMKGFATADRCRAKGIGFLVLTASGSKETEKYAGDIEFCQTDETTLKTMIRSNPGYMMLKNGTITGKWSWANLPDDPGKLKGNTE